MMGALRVLYACLNMRYCCVLFAIIVAVQRCMSTAACAHVKCFGLRAAAYHGTDAMAQNDMLPAV